MTLYQSPISPGRSWYEDSCGERPHYPQLDDNRHCDVVIVGGGFCGLSCALHLASNGVDVVVLEAHRLGDGASGRNGGQIGSGHRAGVLELEHELGFERSKALWDLAQDAKKALIETAENHGFETDYQPGQLTPLHRRRFEKETQAEVAALHDRYGYEEIGFLHRDAMAEALGSRAYYGGTRDNGTGHIHPMKYLIGLGKAVSAAGASVFEETPATKITGGPKISIETPRGTITADRCLLAMNGYHNDMRAELASHVMPIQSFIGATVPLEADTSVLPNGEAVDDSRFVVRYFRKSKDNRLLFGGREAYGSAAPGNIRRTIRKQITEIYPQLADIELTHAWGGNVAITMPRHPYVRELENGLWTAGGFSGHGVMLSNYTGRMIAQNFLGQSEQIKLLQDLEIKPFPGGSTFRNPLKILALTWYAMLDRI